MNRPTRLSQRIAIALLLAMATLWIPWIHLFLLNRENLVLPFSAHLPALGLATGTIAGLAFALQMLGRRVSIALLGLGVFFWAQSTLWIGDFGILGGGQLDWNGHRYLLVLETALLLALGVAAWRWGSQWVDHAGFTAVLLAVGAAVVIYPTLPQRDHETTPEIRHTYTNEGVFEFSRNRNVLIFILDSFQSDVFAEILLEQPELREEWSGFTYFPDTVSTFPRTYPGVPLILTGRAFDNSQLMSEYLWESYLGDSIPHVLKQHRGYDVRFRPIDMQPYFAHPAVVDNLTAIGSKESLSQAGGRERAHLANLTLFRVAPFLLKRWVYNDHRFRFGSPPQATGTPYALASEQRDLSKGNDNEDLYLMDQIETFLTANRDEPAFRAIHFIGTHQPLHIDRDFNLVGEQPPTRPAYKSQAEAVVKMMSRTLAKLRSVDAYDNSLIFIVADHGGGDFSTLGISEEAAGGVGFAGGFSWPDTTITRPIVQGGIPLFLVKPIQATGPLEVSLARAELSDVANTVFGELDLDAKFGPSVFELAELAPRPRLHRHYLFTGQKLDYIVPLTEYVIDGFSWDRASWSRTGRDLNRRAASAIDGALVVLGQGGNLADFVHEGWGDPWPEGRRIVDGKARIEIPLDPDPRPVSLEVRLDPRRMPRELTSVTLSVNDVPVAWASAHKRATSGFWFFIPDRIRRPDGVLDVGIDLGRPGEEKSPIVMDVKAVYTRDRPAVQLGEVLDFRAKSGGAHPHRGHGWAGREQWGMWTYDHGTNLYFKFDPPPSDLVVEGRYLPTVFGNAPASIVDVAANGTRVATLTFERGGEQDREFTIPHELIAEGALDLTYAVHDPRAPTDYGMGSDVRILGLGFVTLLLRPADN